MPTSGANVMIEVAGLPDSKEPTARFTMPFTPLTGGSSPHHAVEAMIPTPTFPVTGETAHYFTTAGFYRMASGVVIWVPAPGYYYGTPVQYYTHAQALTWQPARAAAEPHRQITTPRSTGAPDWIQWESYWRPRAMGDTESYQLWLHGEMWCQQLAGRSPSTVQGNCARCHGR